jgi:hypothetical protein
MNPCYFCLEEISEKGEKSKASPCLCGAKIHRSCMQTWLQKSNNDKCPTCRRKLQHTFDVVIEPQENTQELEEINHEIDCIDRFLHATRVLFYALAIYIVLLSALETTNNLNRGERVVSAALMLGPPMAIWMAFLAYFAFRRLKKCCTERRSQQIVPGIV